MDAIGQISSDMSAALALDLASDIWPEADVFANHGIDPIDGATLLRAPWFRNMVDDARREWNSISNAKQRIRLKSQVAVEMSINDLFHTIRDKNVPAAAKVAAFKELKDISGVAAQEQNAGANANVPSVNIFLNGSDSPAVSITSASPQPSPEVPFDAEVIEAEVTPSNSHIEGMAPL